MRMKPAKRKKYKKTNVYPFLSKMYHILESKPEIFILEKLYDCQGECDWTEDTIKLDYRQQFLSTAVHEVLHYIHPDWCETRVLREEMKIMNSLSICQVRHLIQRIARSL
jgi:hypothetical protein